MFTHSTHQFAEKVAVITNAADPIGKAAALQLALYGAYVVAGMPADAADVGIERLGEMGTISVAVTADASTPEGVDAIMAGAAEKFGRIDLLVNSLKIGGESAFLDMSPEQMIEVFRGVVAAMRAVRAALPLMADRPRARIVNAASVNLAGGAAANAAIRAMEGFTERLATELPANFRVNGVTASDALLVEPDSDPELFAPRRLVMPDDAARAVLYLLSSEAVSVNGQVLRLG